jgi:hypothetical protein
VPSTFQTLVVAGSGVPRSPGNPLIRRCGPHDGVVCLRDTDLFSDAAYRSSKQADEASGRRRLLRSLSSEPGGKRRAADEAGAVGIDVRGDRGTAAVRGTNGATLGLDGRVHSPNIARALVPFGHVSMLYAPSVLQAAVRFIRHGEPGIPVESVPGLPETAQWRDTRPPAASATYASVATIAAVAGLGATLGVAAAQSCLKPQRLSDESAADENEQPSMVGESVPRVQSDACPPLAHNWHGCDSPLHLTAEHRQCIRRMEDRSRGGVRAAAAGAGEFSHAGLRHLGGRNSDVEWGCEREAPEAAHARVNGDAGAASCRVLSRDCCGAQVRGVPRDLLLTSAFTSWTADGAVCRPLASLRAAAARNISDVGLRGLSADPAARAPPRFVALCRHLAT